MSRDNADVVKALMPLLQAARLYHRHEVVGLENVPTKGRTLVVCNHSLATYDIVLLMAALYTDRQRIPRPLIDRLFFKIPYLGDVMTAFGAVQGSHEGATQLLLDEHIVTVAPGGMRESLRPFTQRYQIRWDRRYGFVKLAMSTGAPIVLAACPKADDLYDVYPSHVTKWAYKTFKVPVFLARGIGPTPLPRPIKLVHFLSEPIQPPPMPETKEEQDAVAKELHGKLVKRMKDLISEAIHYR